MKLQFTKKARKSLKSAKRVKLAVKVKLTPATGAAQVVTAAVMLTR